jgi:hypothetical protein
MGFVLAAFFAVSRAWSERGMSMDKRSIFQYLKGKQLPAAVKACRCLLKVEDLGSYRSIYNFRNPVSGHKKRTTLLSPLKSVDRR